MNADGSSLGAFRWEGDTALQFRRDTLNPFFDQYLKERAAKAATPPVLVYNPGENHWERYQSWPLAGKGSKVKATSVYLSAGFTLGFIAPGGVRGRGGRLRRIRFRSCKTRAARSTPGAFHGRR